MGSCKVRYYIWLHTYIKVANLRKICVFLGTASKRCVSDKGKEKTAYWLPSDFSQCTDKQVLDLLRRVRLILL